MENPLVSIIVPVYNVKYYLAKCINSIIGQTYTNLEIILVDDGSSDGSEKICDEYEKVDNRILVIHKINEGVSAARNIGLDYARGEYIAFVDSDDYIASDMIQTLLSRIKTDNSDMACCNYLQVTEDAKLINETQQLPLRDENISSNAAMQCFILWGGYYVTPWNKLYKSQIFKTLRFPVGKRYEDLYIIFQIVTQCKRISHISKTLYFYLRRKDSFTLGEFNICDFDFGDAMINIYKSAKENHYTNLQEYCVKRLSYKFEDWWEQIRNKPEYKKRYKEIKRQSLFLIFQRQAWAEYNIKGKIWTRLRFIFS